MPETHTIQRIKSISYTQFYKDYVNVNKPVIFTDLVDKWPALTKWTLDYLIDSFGETKISAYPLKDGYCDVSVNRGSALNDFNLKETLESVSIGNLNGGLTLATLVNDFPEDFYNDFYIPDYCKEGKLLLSRLFIGPKGVLSPLHQDLPENLYSMVKGKKRIILFNPNSPVYPSRLSKLPNHSYVDPFKPDFIKFPEFEKAKPIEIELVAGETIYLPSLWWHCLENLEPSMAINFWWYQPSSWKLCIAQLVSAPPKLVHIKSRQKSLILTSVKNEKEQIHINANCEHSQRV